MPIFGHAQVIESDKVDPFTGSRSIKTTFTHLEGDLKVQLVAIVANKDLKHDTTFSMNFYFPTINMNALINLLLRQLKKNS